MKKLKIILQSNKLLIFILILIIFLSFIRANFSDKDDVNLNKCLLLSKKIDGNKLCGVLKCNVKIKFTYYISNKEELNFYENLKNGSTLKIIGNEYEIKNNTIPNNFNYKNYIKYNNIYHNYQAEKIILLNDRVNIFYCIKNFISDYIKTFESKEYLSMFILNDKQLLDENAKQNYNKLGISHVFSVSGMHISLLACLLLKILSKVKLDLRYIIVIMFLIFYLFLTDISPSVFRSVVFFILLYFNKKYDFNLELINVFYLTIILILLIKPNYLFLSSFLYSSITSFSLIYFSKIINGNVFMIYLKTSFIAFTFSLPITINLNYMINLLTPLYNVFIVPLISFIVYPMSLLVLIIKPLDSIFYSIIKGIEILFLNIPTLNITIPKLNVLFIVCYYVLIFLFFLTMKKRYFIILIFILLSNVFYPKFDSSLYVYYFDVNQGDSSLIKYKDQIVLIDTGGKINYYKEEWMRQKDFNITDNIIVFLKSIGINKIDYLILTHGDYDHMGNAKYLINNFKIENIVFNNDSFNEMEINLINELNIKKISYLKGISNLKINDINLKFLDTKLYDNENDNSNVLYLKVNNHELLFMGDAGITREKDILDKYNLTDIDFIKIGHHGSNTSSSKYFIDKIKPKNCLISVGKNNRYGHPKESVLNTLDDYCDIFRTDLNGSIEIKINKNNYKIKTYSP